MTAFAVKGETAITSSQFKYRVTDGNGNVSDWLQAEETSAGKGVFRSATGAVTDEEITAARTALGDTTCVVGSIYAKVQLASYAGQTVTVEFAYVNGDNYVTLLTITNLVVPA